MSQGRRLRIIYLANARSVHTQRWVGWFARRHEVRLVSIPALQGEPFDEAHIPLADPGPSVTTPGLAGMLQVLHLRKLIRDFRPDFVHAHSLNPNSWLVAASGFRNTIATAWGSDLLLAKGATKQLQRWALRRIALCTGDSQEAVDRLRELVREPARVHLVQFGVDTAAFQPAVASGELRRSWDVPEYARVLVSPRVMRPLYNHLTVARAFARVAQRHPDLHLVFLSIEADAAYQAALRAELHTLGVLDRVRFAPALARTAMPELYREAAVILSVPSSDTTPVSVLEAMASGTPVIASDLPSLREWISPPHGGWLVPVQNEVALAEALESALALPAQQRLAMGVANRDQVIARASQDHEMTRFERLLYEHLERATR